jgi:hypothetical protein
MKLNADFDQSVVTRPEDYKWVASPMPGVERMMLDRIGDEVARQPQLSVSHQIANLQRMIMMVAKKYLCLKAPFMMNMASIPKRHGSEVLI